MKGRACQRLPRAPARRGSPGRPRTGCGPGRYPACSEGGRTTAAAAGVMVPPARPAPPVSESQARRDPGPAPRYDAAVTGRGGQRQGPAALKDRPETAVARSGSAPVSQRSAPGNARLSPRHGPCGVTANRPGFVEASGSAVPAHVRCPWQKRTVTGLSVLPATHCR